MEQLTWPRASGGLIFSTISASDYGEHDQQQRRHDPLRRRQTLDPVLYRGSGRFSDTHHNHYHRVHRHGSLQIDLEDRASGCGEDYSIGGAHNSFITKNEKQDHEEQAFDCGVEQVRGKTQNFSRKERKQEASASCVEMDADASKTKLSVHSAPFKSAQQESQPCIRRAPLTRCNSRGQRSSVNLSHSDGRNHSYGTVSNFNKVYYSHDTSPTANFSSRFSMLPDDLLLRIMGSFSWPNLWSASRVCRSWCQALAPLRKAMHFVHWGKRFKHGRGGVTRNVDKALHSFLNGAKRGCAAAMVDAGLLMWEMGQKQEGVFWYKQAAELGDPAGQCNLGLAYLQDSSKSVEAVKWFQRAALAGHVRAQYSLALCLQQGKGVDCSVVKAARWYQRAAEGGSARAMYNLALCFRRGEGLTSDSHEARKWMKRAALAGHRKAQFEHGLTLFAENDGGLALVFLELATRAGETAATHLRDALIQQLSPKMRTHAIACADKWQAKLNTRT